MNKTIGTCSLCGGQVTLPTIWYGVTPPTATCSKCGATEAKNLPIITMRPAGGLTPFNHLNASSNGGKS